MIQTRPSLFIIFIATPPSFHNIVVRPPLFGEKTTLSPIVGPPKRVLFPNNSPRCAATLKTPHVFCRRDLSKKRYSPPQKSVLAPKAVFITPRLNLCAHNLHKGGGFWRKPPPPLERDFHHHQGYTLFDAGTPLCDSTKYFRHELFSL